MGMDAMNLREQFGLADATLVGRLTEGRCGDVLHIRNGGEDLVLRRVHGPESLQRLLEIWGTVCHPALVLPRLAGLDRQGRCWVARSYFEGETLDARPTSAGALSKSTVAAWLGGLAALHSAGWLHRDVKPANMGLCTVTAGQPGETSARLLDLDLACKIGESTDHAGTPMWLSPEVLGGQPACAASDLFGLGASLAWALLGDFHGDYSARFPNEDFWGASGLDPGQLSHVAPVELAQLIRELVRRDPLARPASASAALSHLEGGLAGLPGLEPPPLLGRLEGLVEKARLARRSGRSLLLVAEDEADARDGLTALSFAAALELCPVNYAAGILEESELLGRDSREHYVEQTGAVLRLASGADGGLLSDALADPAAGGCVLHAAISTAQHGSLREALVGEPAAKFETIELEPIPLESLQGHLARCVRLSSKGVIAALAKSLSKRTAGQQSLVDSELAQAEELGIARRHSDGWILEREEWPPLREGAGIDLGGLSEAAQELAAALADAPHECSLGQITLLLGWSNRQLVDPALELRAAGVVWTSATGPAAATRDRLRASLDLESRQRGAAALLDRAGAANLLQEYSRLSWRSLEGLAARDEAEKLALVDELETLYRAGRLAAVRGHMDALVGAGLGASPKAGPALLRLQVRVDLAQGNTDAALGALRSREAHGAESEFHVLLGNAYSRSGDTAASAACYELALRDSSSPDTKLHARVGLGLLALEGGRASEALALVPERAGESVGAEAEGALFNLRGGAHLRLGETQEAMELFRRAAETAQRSKDVALAARALMNRAIAERRSGALAEAEQTLQSAAVYVKDSDLLGMRSLVAHNFGTVLRDRGALARAERSFEQALRLRRRAMDSYGVATTLGSLALLRLEQGSYGVAARELGASATRLLDGGHVQEAEVVGSALRCAERLLGPGKASGADVPPAPGAMVGARKWLHARESAARALVDGGRAAALGTLEPVLESEPVSSERAEAFRTLSWAHALGDDPVSRGRYAERLRELAPLLGQERVLEAAFRSSKPSTLEAAGAYSEAFEQAGRLDLAWAAALVQVELAALEGNSDLRRIAARRAREWEERLMEHVPESGLEQVRARALSLAAPWLEPRSDAVHQASVLDLHWFASVNKQLATSTNLEQLMERVLDRAIESVGAQRGLLILNGANGLELMCGRGLADAEEAGEDLHLSRSLIRDAMESGKSIITQDIASDPRFRDAMSVRSLKLRAVLCVPIHGESEALGAVYVDDGRPGAIFDETDAHALGILADQAGAASRQLLAHREIQGLNEQLAQRLEVQEAELVAARRQLRRSGMNAALGGLVGDSQPMVQLRDQILQLGATDLPVLITGPSGSGKELVARALHSTSSRKSEALVIENMAALPESIMESELFGHVRGAFTGAGADRVGMFEEADGGTLFLDEIADVHSSVQAKLLRVLESGEYRRLGESSVRTTNARLVAATNADLAARVAAGDFRQDLYYRLNAAEIRVPSLEDRHEDIPLLVEHFLERAGKRHGTVKSIAEVIVARLVARRWPGQIRELRNEVERLYLLSGDVIADEALVSAVDSAFGARWAKEDPAEPTDFTLEQAERAAILRALARAEGNRAEAARLLGISRAGFYNKLARLEIE